MHRLIYLAAQVAVPKNISHDMREFWVGAVGVRGDGVIVSARNGASRSVPVIGVPTHFPKSHAESRCIQKMDFNGTVYVARISRNDHRLMMSRPCFTCMLALQSRNVQRVFYSINDSEYGVIQLRR